MRSSRYQLQVPVEGLVEPCGMQRRGTFLTCVVTHVYHGVHLRSARDSQRLQHLQALNRVVHELLLHSGWQRERMLTHDAQGRSEASLRHDEIVFLLPQQIAILLQDPARKEQETICFGSVQF